jgi:hypothetical protein
MPFDHSQLYFHKLANAGERVINARGILFKREFGFVQAKTTKATPERREIQTVVGKRQAMSYEDMAEAKEEAR